MTTVRQTVRAAISGVEDAIRRVADELRGENDRQELINRVRALDPEATYEHHAEIARTIAFSGGLTFADAFEVWIAVRYGTGMSHEDAISYMRAGLRSGIVRGRASGLVWAQAASRGRLTMDELRTIAEGS